MEVIALKEGYFGKLRMPGDEFDVPQGSKASWFVPVQTAISAPPASQDDAAADDETKDADAKPAAKPAAKRTRAAASASGGDAA